MLICEISSNSTSDSQLHIFFFFLLQIPVTALGKEPEDDPSAWTLVIHLDDLHEIFGS